MPHNARTEPSGAAPGDDPAARLARAVEAVIRASEAPLAGPATDGNRRDGPGTAADEALQDEVRAYVGILRRDGVTPERVLVTVKELVRHVLTRGPRPVQRSEADELLTRIVEWCVSEYYRAD
jgi:hypothetical protein